MNPSACHRPNRVRAAALRAQRGGSLVVILALLLVVGLIALTSYQVSQGQFALVSNLQHQEQAFQRAEATATAAEQWLSQPANARAAAFSAPITGLTPGLYPVGAMAALGRDPRTMAWTSADSIAAPQGRYIVEQIARNNILPGRSLQVMQGASGSCRSVDLFRIVARSDGTRGASRIVELLVATDGCWGGGT